MNNYKIFEGYDHFNGKPLYKVVGATTETEDYIGEWHTNKSDAERELSSLNLKMAKGGEIGSDKVAAAKRLKVKSWYVKNYPTDDLGEEINDKITFWWLWTYMSQGDNIYDVLGVSDSLVRERVFEKLSDILGVDYDVVYKKWLSSGKYAKGGQIRSKSALAKDRKYTSDEPHELRYRFERKSKVMRYDTKMEQGGGVVKNIDKVKLSIGEYLFDYVSSLNKEELENQLNNLRIELDRMKDSKEDKSPIYYQLKDEEWLILYRLERGNEFKYEQGGSIGGNANEKYLNSISEDKKMQILRNVANHYNVSLEEANEELIDADAEMLYEYVTNQSLRMEIYQDMNKRKFADGGSTNPEIETKKASLAKIMKVRDGANSSEMAKAQAVKVIEKLEKEIAELEASNVAPAASAEKTKKAADSDKSKTDVSPLESIFIEWHEGTGEFDGKTVKTWSELQHILTSIYNNAFKNHGDDGGYEKVKVLFTWKNGKSIGDRIDVGNGGGDFNPTREKIGDYLKKQQGAMYTSNLQVGERPMLSWEDSASKPQRKAVAKKKPTPKAPEKKIKDIDLAVAKSVEPKGGVAKRVAAAKSKAKTEPTPKYKVGQILLHKDDFGKKIPAKIEAVTGWTGKEHRYDIEFLDEDLKPLNKYARSYDTNLSEKEKPKRTKKVITSTKRKKAAVTETPKRKKKVITSAKRKKAAMVDVPTTKRGLAADKKREALPVGKRTSAAGNTYYEYRRNRADRNAKRKLAKGGEVDNYVVTNGEMFLSNRGGRFMLTDNVEMAYTYSKKEAEQQVKHAESLSKDNSKFKVESFRMYNKYANGGEVDSRIDRMVNHWNEKGWAGSQIGNDDSDFFKRIGIKSSAIDSTSFTGSDIKYFDEKRVEPRTGGFREIKA